MLGEKLGEDSGRITGRRVLPSGAHGPEVEVSFESSGTILGVGVNNLATYKSVVRPNGTLYGEGQGIVMTEDGEAASWTGQGVGRFTGQGDAASWRGALYYQTASQKLASLNNVAVVYEYEIDEDGNTQGTFWEWR